MATQLSAFGCYLIPSKAIVIGYSHHCEITLIKHFLDEVGREGNRIGIQFAQGIPQGESVNILLNFTQFFETRIEYRFQI
ncbi:MULTISPECIES: hypothetical protein, partial [unclassified Aeromonas]|uniref:hypothetical protein n=1 Tax=unclassified Aeromonas TaxID=257493 RepID=UPI0022E1E410